MLKKFVLPTLMAFSSSHTMALDGQVIARNAEHPTAASILDTAAASRHRENSNGEFNPRPLRWGVQLVGSFSREQALAVYERERERLRHIIGDHAPVIIETPLGYRGSRPFFRVRIPAASQSAATDMCSMIHDAGGGCIVLSTKDQ